jgi:replicative DNA helicase
MLWAQGESLMIAGRTGVGKTTLTLSILAGLVGIESHCLGLPVVPAERVLYLAMDRPRQIIRAMRRRFGEEHYAILDQRLVVRRGPLPTGIDKVPDMLLTAARRYGCDVIILDSLKDAAVKLVDDEVGGQINRAVQFLNAAGVDCLILHHNRKGDATQKQGDDYEPTVEDVYGSNWITAGAGSVLILHGAPGAELVKLHHVKQPSEPLGPWVLEHDHGTGRTKVVHGFDLLGYLRSRGDDGTTALDTAKAEHPDKATLKASGKEAARAKRRLDGLVRAGVADRVDGVGRDNRGQPTPSKWYAKPVDNSVTLAPKTRDGSRDGWGREEPVTGAVKPVTGETKAQVTALTGAVTPRDAYGPVTGGGGYIPPPSGSAPDPNPQIDLEALGF